MALYASQEWVESVRSHLNADPKFKTSAKGLVAAFQYVVTADPEAGLADELACGWAVSKGECTDVWTGVREEADFVLKAPYGVFKRINTGQQSATAAITTGKLAVKGPMTVIVRNGAAINAIQSVLERMHTEGATEWPA